MRIRQATLKDADAILHLINLHAEMGQMLFRTREDVRAHIRDFLVAEKDGRVTAACGLSFGPGSLVEIRSLAVLPECYRQGIGTALVNECIAQATLAECERIFVLTYAIPVFEKLGFRVIDMDQLPDKIWKDCQGCRKQDHCDETAMIRDLVQMAKPSGDAVQGPGGASPQTSMTLEPFLNCAQGSSPAANRQQVVPPAKERQRVRFRG